MGLLRNLFWFKRGELNSIVAKLGMPKPGYEALDEALTLGNALMALPTPALASPTGTSFKQ